MLVKDTEKYKDMFRLKPGERIVPWRDVPIGTKVIAFRKCMNPRSPRTFDGRYISKVFRLEKRREDFGIWWNLKDTEYLS